MSGPCGFTLGPWKLIQQQTSFQQRKKFDRKLARMELFFYPIVSFCKHEKPNLGAQIICPMSHHYKAVALGLKTKSH